MNIENQSKEKTQVIGCRVTVSDWNSFERVCIESGVSMSDVLRDAITNYISLQSN